MKHIVQIIVGLVLIAVGLLTPTEPQSVLILGFALCGVGGFIVGDGISGLARGD